MATIFRLEITVTENFSIFEDIEMKHNFDFDYNDFKNRVLAKTNGANIHKINGLLALIADGIRHRKNCLINPKEIFRGKTNEECIRQDIEPIIISFLIQIKQLTGVSI